MRLVFASSGSAPSRSRAEKFFAARSYDILSIALRESPANLCAEDADTILTARRKFPSWAARFVPVRKKFLNPC